MKLLEIIELRSVEINRNVLEKELKGLVTDLIKVEEVQNVKIYSRLRIDTYFSVHLFHDSEEIDVSGSSLGLRLASTLKDFGLVNHTIWAERTN